MNIRFYVKHVEISLSFWFFTVLALFLALDADALTYAFMLPVAAHELGHLIAMWFCGAKIQAVSFAAFGINIKKAENLKISYAKEILISASGCLANTVFALGLYFFSFHSTRAMLLTAANIAVALFNLLPVGNLDGGSLVRLLSQRFFPPETALALSRVFSFLALVPLFAFSFFLLLQPERNFTLLTVAVYLAAGVVKSEY